MSAERVDSAIEVASQGVVATPRSTTMAEQAQIAPLPPSVTGGRDTGEPLLGRFGTLDFDIDGDRTDETVTVFVVDAQPLTFVSWPDDGRCHLAWSEAGADWYVAGDCGGGTSRAVVCQTRDGVSSCSACEESSCSECETRGDDVFCDDGGTGRPDAGSPDAAPGDAAPVDLGAAEAGPDGPDPHGACDPSCLELPGAECCRECGCTVEIRCDPACRDGFAFDCEIGCCFDYDLLQCDCPEGQEWDFDLGDCAAPDGS